MKEFLNMDKNIKVIIESCEDSQVKYEKNISYNELVTVKDMFDMIDLNKHFQSYPFIPFYGVLPYVYIEDKIAFDVDISDCKLTDYVKSFVGDNIIELQEVPEGIGDTGGFFSFIEVVVSIISIFQGVEWLNSKRKKFIKFYESFKRKDGSDVLWNSFERFIHSQNEWNINDLKKLLGLEDEEIISILLLWCGYYYSGNDKFAFNKDLSEYYSNKIDEILHEIISNNMEI